MDAMFEKAGYDICNKTLRKKFCQMRVSFYKLKEKPLLEPDDVKTRRMWTTKRKRRSKEGWVSKPKAIIDNKHFEATRCAKSRQYVARRSCRGAYQRQGAPPARRLGGDAAARAERRAFGEHKRAALAVHLASTIALSSLQAKGRCQLMYVMI